MRPPQPPLLEPRRRELAPGVSVVERHSFYPLRAPTYADLRKRIVHLSPLGHDGRFDFFTHWFVRWRWQERWSEQKCRLAGVTVEVDVEYVEPWWVGGSSEERRRWDAYVDEVRAHERGHAGFGIRAGLEIAAVLARVPGAESCESVAAAANAKADRILRFYVAKDREFDIETDHGRR